MQNTDLFVWQSEVVKHDNFFIHQYIIWQILNEKQATSNVDLINSEDQTKTPGERSEMTWRQLVVISGHVQHPAEMKQEELRVN